MRYHQQYQREMKGKASSVGAEGGVTKECADQYGQVCGTSGSGLGPLQSQIGLSPTAVTAMDI